MHDYLSGAGFDYVGETENYVVYRYSYAKPEDYVEPWEQEAIETGINDTDASQPPADN